MGASCCLSVAALISLISPAATLLAATLWIYYISDFLFPFITVILLYLNLRSIEGITESLRFSQGWPDLRPICHADSDLPREASQSRIGRIQALRIPSSSINAADTPSPPQIFPR